MCAVHHTPFARRQSEPDHFQLVLSNERAKTGSEGAWSVGCEGAGVLNGLSGLEPERKRRKGASDVVERNEHFVFGGLA